MSVSRNSLNVIGLDRCPDCGRIVSVDKLISLTPACVCRTQVQGAGGYPIKVSKTPVVPVEDHWTKEFYRAVS